MHPSDWDTPGFLKLAEARTMPLLNPMPVREVQPKPAAGYPSWLYFDRRVCGYYAAVMDYPVLDERAKTEGHDPDLLRIGFYFHELGHLILHRKDLITKSTGGPYQWIMAKRADGNMEDEAWYAAYTALLLGTEGRIASVQMVGPVEVWEAAKKHLIRPPSVH
ncbi:MAG: hypothetical protein NT105_19530 [Verrucomicrobia bacterium]|nr:hypothetical protein [Verrucomicrobiota bacterium]